MFVHAAYLREQDLHPDAILNMEIKIRVLSTTTSSKTALRGTLAWAKGGTSSPKRQATPHASRAVPQSHAKRGGVKESYGTNTRSRNDNGDRNNAADDRDDEYDHIPLAPPSSPPPLSSTLMADTLRVEAEEEEESEESGTGDGLIEDSPDSSVSPLQKLYSDPRLKGWPGRSETRARRMQRMMSGVRRGACPPGIEPDWDLLKQRNKVSLALASVCTEPPPPSPPSGLPSPPGLMHPLKAMADVDKCEN